MLNTWQNPWNEHHWLKKRFFDNPDDETLALTTNYKCNEWLDKADLKVFETMRKQNPRRYAVAGLGDWGIVDGLVYENWHEEAFTLEQIRQQYSIDSAFGLDFGYTNDPSALFCGFIDTKNKKIFVYDEMYAAGGEIQAQTQRNSRVDTGQTKGSYKYMVDEGKDESTVAVGSDLENAIWEEFGTGEYALHGDGRKGGWVYKSKKDGKFYHTYGKTPRQPLTKAFQSVAPKIKKQLVNVIKQNLGG